MRHDTKETRHNKRQHKRQHNTTQQKTRPDQTRQGKSRLDWTRLEYERNKKRDKAGDKTRETRLSPQDKTN